MGARDNQEPSSYQQFLRDYVWITLILGFFLVGVITLGCLGLGGCVAIVAK